MWYTIFLIAYQSYVTMKASNAFFVIYFLRLDLITGRK